MSNTLVNAESCQEYRSAGVWFYGLSGWSWGGKKKEGRIWEQEYRKTLYLETHDPPSQRRSTVWSQTSFSLCGCHVSVMVREQKTRRICFHATWNNLHNTRGTHLQVYPQSLHWNNFENKQSKEVQVNHTLHPWQLYKIFDCAIVVILLPSYRDFSQHLAPFWIHFYLLIRMLV